MPDDSSDHMIEESPRKASCTFQVKAVNANHLLLFLLYFISQQVERLLITAPLELLRTGDGQEANGLLSRNQTHWTHWGIVIGLPWGE